MAGAEEGMEGAEESVAGAMWCSVYAGGGGEGSGWVFCAGMKVGPGQGAGV